MPHGGELGPMRAVAPRRRGVDGLAEEWSLPGDRIASTLGERQRLGTQLREPSEAARAVREPERVRQQRAAARLLVAWLKDYEAGHALTLLDCTGTPSESGLGKPTVGAGVATSRGWDAVGPRAEVHGMDPPEQ